MNLKFLAMLMFIMPTIAFGAARSDSSARVGVNRAVGAGTRGASVSVDIPKSPSNKGGSTSSSGGSSTGGGGSSGGGSTPENPGTTTPTGNCRDAYRACMDDFCLLDEAEGQRCACSSNIEKSKSLIQEIQEIQAKADKLFTEGVEGESLGARKDIVFQASANFDFGTSEKAKTLKVKHGVSPEEWLRRDSTYNDDGSLGEDEYIGDALYETAHDFCASELDSCSDKYEMEKTLYKRQVVADCKTFETYLADQKRYAEQNLRMAEAAVRAERVNQWENTMQYNKGECLLALRSCIADKGGCGVHFENCMDEDLLDRRKAACDNILDQCHFVRTEVDNLWAAERTYILKQATDYADKYMRQTCLAQVQMCLEDSCSTATNIMCLRDINVAAGICPIINECDKKVAGSDATLLGVFKGLVEDDLVYMRGRVCEKDIDACLREKCGQNFTAPECLGKDTSEIVAMCPQTMFPSCKDEDAAQFKVIVSSTLLQMDYKMVQGCVNYFSERLGKVCGTDMACLPKDTTVESLLEVPDSSDELGKLRTTVYNNADKAVDEFFKQFDADKTVADCASIYDEASEADKAGKQGLGASVFDTAKIIARINARNRALRQLEDKIAELSRKADLKTAEQNCLNTYKVENPEELGKGETDNYSYIKSVSFEPKLRNCHVCRKQRVCQEAGIDKNAAGLQTATGAMTALGSAGTAAVGGWGGLIGGTVGAVGGYFAGRSAAQEKHYCEELDSCEDVNM